MRKVTKSHRVKLPLRSYLLYLCVALFLTTGVTFSKYIATSSQSDGAQVAQFGIVTLTETTGNTYSVAPGVPIIKNPKVSMTKSDLAVRVYVDISFGSSWTWENNTLKSAHDLLTVTLADGWSYHSQEGNTFHFSLDLQPGEALENQSVFLNDQIAVSPAISYKEFYETVPGLLDITIQARAVQID